LRRAEGGAKIFGVFRVKNNDFTPKNHISSNCGGRREICLGVSCEKSRFYANFFFFFNFRGGARRVRPPWIRPCNIGHDFLNRAQLQRQPLQVYVISMLQKKYTIIITNRFTVRKYLFLKCQWIISFYVCLFVSSFTDKILPNCIMGDTGRLIWNRSYLLYEHLVIPCWSSL
jgi:hypothetical protein